jgi:hypothetical protein
MAKIRNKKKKMKGSETYIKWQTHCKYYVEDGDGKNKITVETKNVKYLRL